MNVALSNSELIAQYARGYIHSGSLVASKSEVSETLVYHRAALSQRIEKAAYATAVANPRWRIVAVRDSSCACCAIGPPKLMAWSMGGLY